MTQPHKTLAECKDEVAVNNQYKDWKTMELELIEDWILETLLKRFDEAAELYASQFVKKDDKPMIEEIRDYFKKTPDEQLKKDWESVSDFENVGPTAKQLIDSWKKDSVSSDVELTKIRDELYDLLPTDEVNAFDLIKIIGDHLKRLDKYIEQSTQQPAAATINFFSDEEIDSLIDDFWLEFKGTEFSHNAFTKSSLHSIKMFQSKLKDRVNCVDPVEFVDWCVQRSLYNYEKNEWLTDGGTTTKQLLNEYLTSKTNPNGKK